MPQVIAIVATQVILYVGAGSAWAAVFALAVSVLSTRVLSSRPPNAVSPSPELLAQHGAGLRPHLVRLGLGEAQRVDLFDGFADSPTMRAIVSDGQCLEPEYPGGGPLGRTVFLYDAALPVRSGDLAIVENVMMRPVRRGQGLGGGMLRETSMLVKYAERKDSGEWLLHSNDEPFLLTSNMKFLGRVTAALVMPDRQSMAA